MFWHRSKEVVMAFKAKFNNFVDWGKVHSPEILLVTGLIEGAVGTVLACKATLRAKKKLEERKVEENTQEKYECSSISLQES